MGRLKNEIYVQRGRIPDHHEFVVILAHMYTDNYVDHVKKTILEIFDFYLDIEPIFSHNTSTGIKYKTRILTAEEMALIKEVISIELELDCYFTISWLKRNI